MGAGFPLMLIKENKNILTYFWIQWCHVDDSERLRKVLTEFKDVCKRRN